MTQEAHTTREAQMTHEVHVKYILSSWICYCMLYSALPKAHRAHEAPMARK